eukprot:SAG11_NODE_983_length_6306_cov_19.831319_8_plen_92_part_00
MTHVARSLKRPRTYRIIIGRGDAVKQPTASDFFDRSFAPEFHVLGLGALVGHPPAAGTLSHTQAAAVMIMIMSAVSAVYSKVVKPTVGINT